MIKINLASKKQAVVADGGPAGAKRPAFSLKDLDFDSIKSNLNFDLLRDPQIRKLVIVGVLAIVGYFALDTYETDQVKKLDEVLVVINADNIKLTSDLTKTKGYEAIKLEIDTDEKILQTKLTTIKSLINDRQVPSKLLLALSNDIPSETWLSTFSLSDKDLKLQGSSVGYTQITDFMKMLNESEYLTEVKLVNSKQEKDKVGIDIASFELSAKRK